MKVRHLLITLKMRATYLNILIIKPKYMHWFLKFIFGVKLYMFRTGPLSIACFSLYTQQWYLSYRFADIYHCCVCNKKLMMVDRNCSKHVEFYSKNKFEKLLQLVPLGRPRLRWVDNIRTDLQEVGCGYMDWIGLAQDRDRWRTLVSAVMNLRVPWNEGNFLTNCKPVSFSRRTLHHGVSKCI